MKCMKILEEEEVEVEIVVADMVTTEEKKEGTLIETLTMMRANKKQSSKGHGRGNWFKRGDSKTDVQCYSSKKMSIAKIQVTKTIKLIVLMAMTMKQLLCYSHVMEAKKRIKWHCI